LLGHIRRLFNWAIARGVYGLERSPCDRMRPKTLIGKKALRTRVLSDGELRAFWRATEAMPYPYGPLFRILALTGQRKSEVAEARWSEFDLERKRWAIPAERMKADAPHVVPLTDDVIAILAALLAVGMSLDEIPNDITKKTPSCFEPTIDYVVVKIPKWQFEKFHGADPTLGTQMKSVGEVMAIGRTFKEALQKGIRSLEPSSPWRAPVDTPVSLLREKIATPRPDRIHWLFVALERGISKSGVLAAAIEAGGVVHERVGAASGVPEAVADIIVGRPCPPTRCAY
jgi:hypothetical protein